MSELRMKPPMKLGTGMMGTLLLAGGRAPRRLIMVVIDGIDDNGGVGKIKESSFLFILSLCFGYLPREW